MRLLPGRPHRLVSRPSHRPFEILSECHILGLLRRVLQADLWYGDGVPCVGHSGGLSDGGRGTTGPLHISDSAQVLETLCRFLWTVVERDPSGWCVITVSKNASLPFSSGSRVAKLDGSFNRVEVVMEGRELVGVESSTCVIGNTH